MVAQQNPETGGSETGDDLSWKTVGSIPIWLAKELVKQISFVQSFHVGYIPCLDPSTLYHLSTCSISMRKFLGNNISCRLEFRPPDTYLLYYACFLHCVFSYSSFQGCYSFYSCVFGSLSPLLYRRHYKSKETFNMLIVGTHWEPISSPMHRIQSAFDKSLLNEWKNMKPVNQRTFPCLPPFTDVLLLTLWSSHSQLEVSLVGW